MNKLEKILWKTGFTILGGSFILTLLYEDPSQHLPEYTGLALGALIGSSLSYYYVKKKEHLHLNEEAERAERLKRKNGFKAHTLSKNYPSLRNPEEN